MRRPSLPQFIRDASIPGYINAFSDGYAPRARNLYCTEELLDGYEADTLLLMKDACASYVIRNRVVEHHELSPWRPGGQMGYDREGVRTNRRLLRLAPLLATPVLAGSIMANLLRDDGAMSGTLPEKQNIKLWRYVNRVLDWVTGNMPNLRVVICAGDDAWDFTRKLRNLHTERRPQIPAVVRAPDGYLYARVQHPGCRKRWSEVEAAYAALGSRIAADN